MTLVIDNYDSFTFNLVQAIEGLGVETKVVRNDQIDVAGIAAMNPDRLVISPGPGNPDSAGVSLAAVKAFAGKIPILGVCLGHQTVAQAFGGRIVPAKSLMHGKTSRVRHDGKGIFADVPQGFEAMRYHSLAVERATLPDCLEVSAETDDGEIMALRHRTLPIETVQYHPESIGTPEGVFQLRNFFGLGEGSKSPAETVAYHEFRGILRGDYTERELSALLTLGREDAVSPDRLLGAARAMRDAMAKIDLGECSDAVDLVGTGGDGHPTINISTTAAFVAAGAGVRIAKHGNVAATSKSGAADVLRAFKTLFNLLGPLTNPAGVVRHAIGVYDPKVVPVIAQTLLRLGCRRALVFSGVDGMDEISPVGVTLVAEVRDGEVKTGIFDGGKVAGLGAGASLDELAGGNAQENAAILRATLRGEVRGVCRAAVLLNAAAAIVAGEKAETLEEGYRLAEESIDSGRALEKLEEFVSCNSRNR